jgi:hypothetical protein
MLWDLRERGHEVANMRKPGIKLYTLALAVNAQNFLLWSHIAYTLGFIFLGKF